MALYRMDDAKKKMIFHGYLETADATEAAVAGLFGGGKYRAQLRVADELGREVIKRSRDFTLPGAYRPPTNLPGVSSGSAAPAAPAQGASTQPLASGEALNTALVSQVIDMLTKMREPKSSVDWTPIITAVTSLLTTVLTAVLSRPKDDSMQRVVDAMNERMDKLTEMLAAQQKATAAGPASGAMADAVKAVKDLLEVKDMLEGGEGKADPTDAMLLALPKLIDRMAGAAPAQPQRRTPVTPLPPNAAPWQRFLLANKARLLQFASMGLEPDLTAEMALRFLKPELAGVVREFLSKPDAAEQAMLTIPELRGFEQWTREFIEETRAQFFDEGGEEEELGGEDVTGAEGEDDAQAP